VEVGSKPERLRLREVDRLSSQRVPRLLLERRAIVEEDPIELVLVVQVLDAHREEGFRDFVWRVLCPVAPGVAAKKEIPIY